MSEVLVPYINCLLVLDGDGDRIIAKYYSEKSKADQTKFESTLHKKTKSLSFRSDAEIILLEQELVVIKGTSDCRIIISGSIDENELVLVSVLDAIHDTVLALLRGQLDKRTMLDNLELVLLTIDEVIDNGQIMELDACAVATRVLMKGSAELNVGGGGSTNAGNTGDMTIAQALGLARNQFIKSLTSGN
mmetsp:Transcript_2971/g.4503  ORF Transcript_2971/g.4503 Transcript_2971/m.4503 type:complete len:190 (+) Transcript_2971:97-666(+)|eukprot:CAMPEP_0185018826 /NCGR_PEP_ID=MMETSP1103-20130426/1502_1 /TAXON_ID=36769 /ORGANISM="Paraphysomonas bandaiensis, Strain Caron Lab Isolate" /LENGTH=189 /DNA_ID=CAMNT_0027548825 /DNA_START=32 /DNA_END=604 /DNA_ORIENTATION=+